MKNLKKILIKFRLSVSFRFRDIIVHSWKFFPLFSVSTVSELKYKIIFQIVVPNLFFKSIQLAAQILFYSGTNFKSIENIDYLKDSFQGATLNEVYVKNQAKYFKKRQGAKILNFGVHNINVNLHIHRWHDRENILALVPLRSQLRLHSVIFVCNFWQVYNLCLVFSCGPIVNFNTRLPGCTPPLSIPWLSLLWTAMERNHLVKPRPLSLVSTSIRFLMMLVVAVTRYSTVFGVRDRELIANSIRYSLTLLHCTVYTTVFVTSTSSALRRISKRVGKGVQNFPKFWINFV